MNGEVEPRDVLADAIAGDRPYPLADALIDALDRYGYVVTERPPHDLPAVGFLVRSDDVTGLSGTGRVAWIVEFPDGPCVVRWCVSDVRQTAVFDCCEDVLAIHGHDGRTKAEWHDDGGEWSGDVQTSKRTVAAWARRKQVDQ